MSIYKTLLKKWIVCFFLLFASSQGFAHIIPIDSIHDLKMHVAKEDQTLVVFDIDDTLSILTEPAFQRPNFKTHHAEIFKNMMTCLNAAEQIVALTLPLLTTDTSLIEEQAPAFIKNLQENRVKVIALTAAMGGEIGDLSIEDRRIQELNRLGIDFSSAFEHLSEVSFASFEEPVYGKHPMYKKGVILANEQNKGSVLVEFLKTLSWKPEQILFIDDRIDHLHAVKKALDQNYPEIDFKGLHYQTHQVAYEYVDEEAFRQKWEEVIIRAKNLMQ